jgi:hypothetical protein
VWWKAATDYSDRGSLGELSPGGADQPWNRVNVCELGTGHPYGLTGACVPQERLGGKGQSVFETDVRLPTEDFFGTSDVRP